MRRIIKTVSVLITVFCVTCFLTGSASAASIQIGTDNMPGVAQSLQLLFLLTVLSLAPSIILMMTSFTRISIVMSFVRSGLGLQQTPPNQVLVGLSLFLTLFIMTPVAQQVNNEAFKPYSAGTITQEEAVTKALQPVKTFMLKQTNTQEMKLFLSLSGNENPTSFDDIAIQVLIPAFVLSEIKKAFIMGFMILIPFIIVDMVVASTLLSIGMIMVPPAMISLPFKLILFVVVDGWRLVVKTLVLSFHS